MRTTLTIDDDVAAVIDRLRRDGKRSLKDVINDVLRRGIASLESEQRDAPAVRTRAVSLGGSRLPDVDNIGEVLAAAEGEDYK